MVVKMMVIIATLGQKLKGQTSPPALGYQWMINGIPGLLTTPGSNNGACMSPFPIKAISDESR